MKVFNIKGQLNNELLDSFTEFFNANENEEWTVYIESTGGSCWIQEQLSYLLNLKSGTTTLNIVRVYSSAFSLMINFNGRINILPGARGMIHQSRYEQEVLTNGDFASEGSESYNRMIKSENRIGFTKEKNELINVLSKEEMDNYIKGNDIYFTDKQLIKILKLKNK